MRKAIYQSKSILCCLVLSIFLLPQTGWTQCNNTEVTTLAGMAGTRGSTNGTGTAASFRFPFGVATDAAGNVYVADRSNHLIRKITPAGVVTTLAGMAGTFGSTNGTGTAASFSLPTGVATDAAGNVYVADFFNHLIRKIGNCVVAPTAPTAPIPTMSQWGLLVFGLLIMNLSVFFVQRRELI